MQIPMSRKTHLYINDGNFDFTSRVIDNLPVGAQRYVNILQQIRDALLDSSIQYDAVPMLELEDILQDHSKLPKGVQFYIQELSRFFDEFGVIEFAELERFERKFIEKVILMDCIKRMEKQE